MRIIIVSPSLDPSQNVSGISSVTQFIISNNRGAEYLHFELGRKDKERGGWHRVRALLGRYRAWKRLLGEHPDALIHYNLPLSKSSLLRDPWFIRYAVRRGRKMVIHVHGGLLLTSRSIPIGLKPILRWVFGLDVPFIVLSENERQTLVNRFGAKDVSVLPNCVDLQDAKEYEAENVPKDKNRPLNIGYLGRIEPNKGISEMLAACLELAKEGVSFHLTLAGKEQTAGEYLPRFTHRLGNRFTYAGVVSGQRKRDFLRSLDVFLMPTYFEGLPMSLLECMSYGIVPVVTPVGSIPQVVADGVNGLMIRVKDVQSIVEAIRRLSEDRNLTDRLGSEARRTIFARFSPEAYVENLNAIYKKAL